MHKCLRQLNALDRGNLKYAVPIINVIKKCGIYWYLDDFRRGISVFAIFSYGIAVLGTPQCPPPLPLMQAFLGELVGREEIRAPLKKPARET